MILSGNIAPKTLSFVTLIYLTRMVTCILFQGRNQSQHANLWVSEYLSLVIPMLLGPKSLVTIICSLFISVALSVIKFLVWMPAILLLLLRYLTKWLLLNIQNNNETRLYPSNHFFANVTTASDKLISQPVFEASISNVLWGDLQLQKNPDILPPSSLLCGRIPWPSILLTFTQVYIAASPLAYALETG